MQAFNASDDFLRSHMCGSVSRWSETLIAVSDSSLLNEQSYKKCQEDSLSENMSYKSVTGNNWMMTLLRVRVAC